MRKYRRAFSAPRESIAKDGAIRYRAAQHDCEACMLRPKCCPNMPHARLRDPFMKPPVTRPVRRKGRGLRRLVSRTKESRDALRSSEAHPQAWSIAPPWPERGQRRVPISRHRPKSAETGEAHPPPGADLRHIRRRTQINRPDRRRNRYPLSSADGVLQHNPSKPAGRIAHIALKNSA